MSRPWAVDAAPATAPTAVAGSGPSRIGRPGQSHIDAGGAQLCQTVDDVACVTASYPQRAGDHHDLAACPRQHLLDDGEGRAHTGAVGSVPGRDELYMWAAVLHGPTDLELCLRRAGRCREASRLPSDRAVRFSVPTRRRRSARRDRESS